MPSRSKIKGSAYEREVASRLTNIYNVQFIRNISGSGAYVGGTNSSRKQYLTEAQIRSAKGDIVPPDSFKKLNCECKSYGEFSFHQLVGTQCKQLEQWLQQLLAAGDDHDCNVLFFKITRLGEWVAVESKLEWVTDQASYTRYSSDSMGYWYIFDYDTFFRLNKEKLEQYSA